MELRTVEWKDDSVIMIDQTKLPNNLEFVTYDDFNQIAERLINPAKAIKSHDHRFSRGFFFELFQI